MSKVVCKTCACQTLRLFSSRCNADRKRQHCCCCHLLNKVDNIERALDISCTYNALEDTSKIAPSTSVLWHCWLGGRKGIRPVKNWVVGCWRGYLSGARCSLAYGPADATATHSLASVKSRLVSPFWYWLTWVVPEKGPLNGCVCVCAPSTTWFLGPTRVLTQMAPRSVSKRCVFAEQTISVCNQPVIVTQACSASHLSGNVFNCYVEVAVQCLFLPNCTN